MPVYKVGLPRAPATYSQSGMDTILRSIEVAFNRLQPHVPYGIFYQYEVPTTIAIAASNTYYLITGNTAGYTNGVSFASNALTIDPGGKGYYLAIMDASLSDGGGVTFELSVFVDGVQSTQLSGDTGTSGALHTHVGATGILLLNAGSVVDLRVKNHTSTSDPEFQHVHLTLVRISEG